MQGCTVAYRGANGPVPLTGPACSWDAFGSTIRIVSASLSCTWHAFRPTIGIVWGLLLCTTCTSKAGEAGHRATSPTDSSTCLLTPSTSPMPGSPNTLGGISKSERKIELFLRCSNTYLISKYNGVNLFLLKLHLVHLLQWCTLHALLHRIRFCPNHWTPVPRVCVTSPSARGQHV